MFKVNVDEEISLYLVNEQFVYQYSELAKESYDHLSEWLEWPRNCRTENDFRAFVKGSLQKYAEGKAMNCAIEYNGEIVGNCGFNLINHDLKVAEIGYWIGHQYQGLGIVTRSCQFLIDHAFDKLMLNKVQISAAETNLPSRAVCERLGMDLEGVITNKEKVGNKILNHAIYGIHRKTT